MNKSFTPLYQRLFFLFSFLFAAAFAPADLYAQCSATTPVYEVNLTGKPNGKWTSPTVRRNGTCCTAPNNQTCVQFNITLDALSGGLQFEISSGPVPAGVMTYQVDCGPSMAVGDSICVTGPGPHELSICMPGNSANTFTVYSIAAYDPVADANVTGGCTTTLQAPLAFDPASVQWNDITGGGAYNSYLSCTSGCPNPTVTPDANPPAFVDYTVCGNSTSAVCTDIPYCDTVRVYFHPPITASINPNPAIVCPGSGTVDLVGSATGGSGLYNYFWFDNAGNQLANTQTYTANAAGTYRLEVRNENYPNCTPFTTSVNVVENLSVNAGADQQICANESAQLAGSVNAASGGVWSGGAGLFSPDATALNATYTPTADELAAGSLLLTLTTTGNGSCDPLTDQVLLSFYAFELSISAPALLCTGTTATLTAMPTGGTSPYSYLWSSGETTQSISNKPAGNYTVWVTDGEGCTFEASTSISQEAGPTEATATATASTCSQANGELTVSSVTGGTAPYSYSIDGTNFQSSETFSKLLANTYELTIKDANGCLLLKSFTVPDQAGPSSFTASLSPASCSQANGGIEVSGITGGTSPYSYSIDGSTFQASSLFAGLAAGSYTLWVKDANGCTHSQTGYTLTNQAGPTAVTASAFPASCTDNDGRIEVDTPTGGTAPFTYSIDGTNFQGTTTFSGLASASYTVTARDANGCTITTTAAIAITEPTDLEASLSPSSCGKANGEIAINMATGGVTPYTFSVDGTNFQASVLFNGLMAGNYTLWVKDANGCLYSEGVVLEDQPGPTDLSLSTTSSTCGNANGEISVSAVTGGTAPYTYSIDGTNFQPGTTFGGLAAGTYTLSVKDANGCLYAESIGLSNVPGPSDLTSLSTSSTCGNANGSLEVATVSGGTAPYLYSIDGTNFQSSATFSGLAAATYTLTVKDANGCLYAEAGSISDIAGPSDFTATITSSTCGNANGEISVSAAAGGSAPYTYSIDGITYQASERFSALAAGTYTLFVKDANECSFSKQLVLTDIAGPSAVSATTKAASCADNDGSLQVGAVTGGIAPYTYSIDGTTFQGSTSFSGLASGTYTVVAKDANGCTVSTSATIQLVKPEDLGFTTVATSCGKSNGEISITEVKGGQSPFSYSIDGTSFQTSATFSGLTATTYTLTVKDANNCLYSEQAVLTDIAGPSAMSLKASSSTCSQANGQIEITALSGGTAPYSYSLDGTNFQESTLFTAVAAATYTVSVKDANGCLFAEDIQLSDIPGPTDFTAGTTASTCSASNGEISIAAVAGGTGPYTYSIDGLNFQTSATFSGLLAASYTLTVKDANNCLFTKEVILSDIPGPADFTATTVSATCGEPNGSIRIESVNGGTAPYAYSANGLTFQASSTLNGLSAGTYAFVVRDANNCTFTKEVILDNIAGPTAISASSQPATCQGNDGSIRVESITGGTATYSYSLDGINFQAATTFSNLAYGRYTLTGKDANGCMVSTSILVDRVGPTDMIIDSQESSCGANTGSLSVSSVSGGPSPYTYSIDGTNFQTSSTFSDLYAGLYTVWVKDANGCTYSEEASINDLGGATAVTTKLRFTSCGESNGEISVTEVTGGTSPYTYSIDGTNFQSSGTFSALAAATYRLQLKDANGCLFSQEVVLEDQPGPADMSVASASSTCGDANGALSINSIKGGTAPYTYSIDGSNFQEESTFSGLAAATYTLFVKDANACLFSKEAVLENIPGPTGIRLSTSSSLCSEANGSLLVEGVTGGTAPYTYSIDGTTFQSGTLFEGLLAGSYKVSVKDVYGCIFSGSTSLTDIAGPSAVSATTKTATCADNDGSLQVGAVTGGTAPYTYSIDGTTFQGSTSFSGLASGTYTVVAKDANGCTVSTSASVPKLEPSDFDAGILASTCGNSNGEISIKTVSGGLSPYTYSIDGSSFQASTTFSGLKAATYTLWVKDANGCTYSRQLALPDRAGPTDISPAIEASTCGLANGEISFGSISGGTAPYSYSLDGSNFQASERFTGLAAGSYQLTVKDANGCLYSENVELENIAGPNELTISSSSSSCSEANGEVMVTAVTGGTAPYTYSIDGINFQAEQSFASLLAGSYELTVKDANGCTFSKEVVLEDIPGPTALNAETTPSSCGQADGTLQVNSQSGGTAPYSYSLDGINYQQEALFTGLSAGEQQLRVKDANGCVYQESITIGSTGGPTGLEAEATAATCGESNGLIRLLAVNGGTAPYSYSINGTTYQASETFSVLRAGSYNLSVKDANGCTFSKEVVVDDASGATAIATSSTPSTCTENTGSLQLESVSGGTAPYTYSIDGINYQAEALFSGLGAGSYTVYVKDANSCISRFSETVATNGPQAAETSLTSASCGEADGSIRVDRVSGGTAPFTYSLDGTNYQTEALFSGLVAGTYKLSVQDAGHCILELPISLSNSGGPEDFVVSTTDPRCGDSNGSISISEVTGGTSPYTYSVDGNSYQSSSTFNNLAEGIYQLSVKDANGCILFRQDTLENSKAPAALAYSLIPASCGAANGSLQLESVSGGTAPYTYSIGGSRFQESGSFSALTAGTYNLYVKDANGCIYSESFRIEGIEGPAEVSFRSIDASCDEGGSLTIEEVVGGTAPYLYSLDGTRYQSALKFDNLLAGSYTLYVKDANNCSLRSPVQIFQPGVRIDYLQDISCYGTADGKIAFRTNGGKDSPQFSIDGGKTYQQDSVFNNLAPGYYSVHVQFTASCTQQLDSLLIEQSDSLWAQVTPTAKAIGKDFTGSAVVSKVEGGIPPYTYALNEGSFGADSIFTQLSGGQHLLLVQDAAGCIALVPFSIELITDLEIPNSFTPNGDGINDGWALKNLAILYPQCRVSVYNRWGAVVFKSEGYAREWDGTNKGQTLPDATYYYIIQLKEGEAPLRGAVTIMR